MAGILDLLMALNRGDLPGLPRPAPSAPIPYAPIPNLGPLSEETTAAYGALNPEPVPPRFVQPAPVNEGFVNQYSGQEPTRPVIPPASTLQKIAAVLSGISEGPGYGMALKQQREEPIRRYERDLERYQGRRAQGIELAERRAEREAAQANRANEMLYESEYKKWLAKNNDRSDEAKERMRQMFVLQRDANAARLEEEREQRRERRAMETDAKVRTGRFFTVSKNMALSTELGRHYAGLSDKPLSPAAAKLDAQLQGVGEAQMGRAARIGGAGGGGVASGNAASLERQFNSLKARFLRAEQGTPRSPRGDRALMERIAKQFTAVMDKLAKLGYEVGFDPSGIYPYIKPPQGQQQTAQPAQGQQNDPLGIR